MTRRDVMSCSPSPHQRLILLHPVGASIMSATAWPPPYVVGQAAQRPDTAVSRHTYYWDGTHVHRVTALAAGRVRLTPTEAFAHVLARL